MAAIASGNLISPQVRAEFYFGTYANFDLESYTRLLDGAPCKKYQIDREMLYTYRRYAAQTGLGGSYRQDMDRFLELNSAINLPVLVLFGDRQPNLEVPVFTKTRRVGTRNGILLRLNRARHWNFINALREDQPWQEKLPQVIWRGAPTGYDREDSNPRLRLVEKFFDELNVGFSVGEAQGLKFDPSFVKGKVTISEQLRHKYIISVEGNDVATNLKWILASNSIPIMPKPTIDSWLMESLLEPYVHYVPVNRDFSNLPEVLDWCRDHDEDCRQISENGRNYMQHFDEAADLEIEKRIFAMFRELTDGRATMVAREAKQTERIIALEAGLKSEPDRIDAYGDPYYLKELVRQLISENRWEDAIKMIPVCEKSGPKGWYHILFARGLDLAGKNDEALRHWRAFAADRPRHVEANLRLRNLRGLEKIPSPFREILSKVPQFPVETVFDVGANTGQSCIPYHKAFQTARIHAFEPLPERFGLLCERIREEARPASGAVIPHNIALSDRVGSMRFSKMGHSTENQAVNQAVDPSRSGEAQEVQADTLEGFCKKNGIAKIDVLKIDTGGHDLAVLRGGAAMLSEVGFIQCEASANLYNKFHNSYVEIFEYLSARNFFLFDIHGLTYEPSNDGYPVLRRFYPIFVNGRLVDL
ncbi:FkbM family methyltransferase [Fuscovulum ytuae]|uniref:FkbM family methyltransferase n=1 Tax=Fuscovulum ytuae TaxID=3042299 RepID=A0ABY8Q6Z2_9RHOB|nr:FkbM family methyltransferase [Fuscovulum sp. YMD61]WGV16062.1 FkbM family methyltransferase [Fuscovulum sp. YMD61]